MAAPPPPIDAREAVSSPALPALVAGSPAIETVEVRWWHDRPLPSELHEVCVEAAGPAGDIEHRVDTYLRHCGDDLSVKIRGADTLDVKQRCGPVTVSVLVAGVQGRVEQWRKWTFRSVAGGEAAGDADAPAPSHETDESRHWLAVEKTRCLVGEGSATVELTEVRITDRPHWTLALEGPVDIGLVGLRDAAAALQLGRFPRWFGIETSTSYATFVEPPSPAGLGPAASG
ncbi:MAG: hypothetical protein ACE367_07320 [Acidimicrobiales bacterium]